MNRDSIYLPRDVIGLLQTLQSAGHTAYVVGGCVRDSLLGRTPGDWDICTSARPEEMRRLFADHQLILTGEKHGTVAVVLHGKPYEMTTYRLDGRLPRPPPSRCGAVRGRPAQGPGPAGFYHQRHGLRPGQGHY